MAFLIENAISVDFDERRSALKATLDHTALRLVAALRGRHATQDARVGIFPCVKDAYILFQGIYDEKTLEELAASRCTVRQRSILESDQRNISIKFTWKDTKITVRIQLYAEFFTITVVADVLAEMVADSESGQFVHMKDFAFLTTKFWEDYTNDLFTLPDLKGCFANDIFRHVFADIRGVILSDESVKFRNSDFRTQTAKPEWASDVISELRPIVTQDDRYECTASYLLGGRVLYATALGPQPPEFADDKRVPLTFLLCAQQKCANTGKPIVNARQLGRLVDRMHILGTTRLAALLDLRLMRDVSRKLSQIDGKIKEARDLVQDFSKQKGVGRAARIALEDAQNYLNSITNGFLTADDNIGKTGLTYRVEASRYYVTLFKQNLPALRLCRVEGYQRYDQFIERRLGSTYDFIDRLGLRYERAATVLSQVEQSYSTIQSSHSGVSVEKIQRYGEIILISFLIPYYIISTIVHIHEFYDTNTRFVIAFFITAFYANAAYQILIEKSKANKRHTFIRVASILAIIIPFVLAFIFWAPVHTASDETAARPSPSAHSAAMPSR